MPISVTPSKLVVIDASSAGPDDLLQVTLEDGRSIYLEARPGPYLGFSLCESQLPAGARKKSRQAAIAAIKSIEWDGQLRDLQTIYEQRSDKSMSLVDFVAREMRRQSNVRGDGTPINVGVGLCCVFQVQFEEPSLRLGSFNDRELCWIPPAKVAYINSVTRFYAQVSEARNS